MTPDNLDKKVQNLESMVSHLQTTLEKLQEQVETAHRKNTATCENCKIEFDVFANHYSIGLFDNIVYTKCPRCNQGIPVDRKDGIITE